MKPSLTVQVQRMTAPFAVIRDILDLFGGPVLEFEIVRHDAGAFFQLPVQNGLHLIVDRFREQVNGDQIGGTIVLFQQVAVQNVGVFLQPEKFTTYHP